MALRPAGPFTGLRTDLAFWAVSRLEVIPFPSTGIVFRCQIRFPHHPWLGLPENTCLPRPFRLHHIHALPAPHRCTPFCPHEPVAMKSPWQLKVVAIVLIVLFGIGICGAVVALVSPG